MVLCRRDRLILCLMLFGYAPFLGIRAIATEAPPLLVQNQQNPDRQADKERQAEAERLHELSGEQFQNKQYQAAISNLQKALAIYREIRDRNEEISVLADLGIIYLHGLKQYQTAINVFEQMLALSRDIKDRDGESDALLSLGICYDFLGQYQTAIRFFEQRLVIAREQKDREVEASSLYHQGNAYKSLEQYQKAIEFYELSLTITREVRDRGTEMYALVGLGEVYNSLKQYQKAIEFFQSALVIGKELGNRALEGEMHDGIGESYYKLGQHLKAIEFYQQALAITKELGDRAAESGVFNNIGVVYNALGNQYAESNQYDKAVEAFVQASSAHQAANDRQGQAIALYNLGNTYLQLNQYDEALKILQQAISISQAIGDRQVHAKSLYKLGGIYLKRSQYDKVIEVYQQAISIFQAIGDRKEQATVMQAMGVAYGNLGRYSKALEFLEQALPIYRAIGDRSSEGSNLRDIGTYYSHIGQYPKALEFYQKALDMRKELSDRSGEIESLTDIGDVYIQLKEYGKALESYQQALAKVRDGGATNSNVEELYRSLALVYDILEQYPEALRSYQKSLELARASGARDREGRSLNGIAGVYSRLGQYPKALEFYQQALIIARELNDRPNESKTLRNIGIVYEYLKRYPEAVEALFSSIQILESLRPGLIDNDKISLFDKELDVYRSLERVLIIQNNPDQALEVTERGRARAFVELLASKLAETSTTPPPVQPLTLQQIQQIAKNQNTTLVEYSIADFGATSELFIWVIKPTGETAFQSVDLKTLNTPVSELVTAGREAIGVRSRSSLQISARSGTQQPQQLRQLHDLLIKPITAHLPTNPNDRVMFIPQGELFLVPFAALQDAGGKYLIEKHTIQTAPSIQVLQFTHEQRQRLSQQGGQALVMGNPTMPKVTVKLGDPAEQLNDLPGAEQEAVAIAQLLNTQALTGSAATKAAILPKLSQARIVHLATHGLLDDFKGLGVPGAIALAPSGTGELNDGLLTASEILDLKLKAELVVLSACDTGRGRLTGDGVIGLSRSLISAGVPSVLVSLWSVPDAPTAELMMEFYRNLQKNSDKAQALRQAMLTTMKQHPHPRDWAAFTLIGEP